MRVLVCGSRTYSRQVLPNGELGDEYPDPVMNGFLYRYATTVIHGGARGADKCAAAWAEQNGILPDPYPADWDKHGKAAGPIRNQQMLDEGKPDVVIAFVDKPLAQSRGTADMVRRAKAAGLPVYVVEKIQ